MSVFCELRTEMFICDLQLYKPNTKKVKVRFFRLLICQFCRTPRVIFSYVLVSTPNFSLPCIILETFFQNFGEFFSVRFHETMLCTHTKRRDL